MMEVLVREAPALEADPPALGWKPDDLHRGYRVRLDPKRRRALAYMLRLPPYSYTLSRISKSLNVCAATIWTDLSKLPEPLREDVYSAKSRAVDGRYMKTRYRARKAKEPTL